MHNNSIFRQLLINVITSILIALVVLAFLNYTHTKSILVESYEEKNYVIYDEIRYLARFQDIALELLENSLNERMREFSYKLVYEYFKDSSDIQKADLYKIRKQLGLNPELEDIYIINKNGIVIKTTYKRDLFLNFFNFGDEHKTYLLGILKGGQFVSERFTIEDATKRLRKFSYQPSLDGNYIIEIGVFSKKADDIIELIKGRLIEISNTNNQIKTIDLFLGPDNPFSLNQEVQLDEDHKSIITEIFKSKKNRTIVKNEGSKELYYEYIYMERKNTDLYKSLVIRIVSDRSFEYLYLRNELLKIFIVFGITILIIVILIYKNTQVITAPIEKLVESMDIITEGDLKQRAEVKGASNEIQKLTRHFNLMLEKIEKRAIENQIQKEEIQSQAQQLSIINKELEKLSIVASKTDNGVSIYNQEGYLEWINVGFEKIFGYSYSEIVYNIGGHITDFHENPDINLLVNICLKTKQSLNFETQATVRSGKKIWIQTTLTPILDESNNIVKFVAIDSNITAQKKIEEKLRQKNKDITDSIYYARRIQESMVPKIEEFKKIFPELFIFNKPRDIVSGDFYWFNQKGDKIIFAVADCTGHSFHGSLIAMIGITFLNEIVIKNTLFSEIFTISANNILNQLKDYIDSAFFERTNEVLSDGMEIAICIFDTKTRKLQYSGAQIPLIIIRNEEIIEISADKLPLGIIKKEDFQFLNHEYQLECKDLIYLYTDGFANQFGGENIKKFLASRLKKILLNNCSKSIEEQHLNLESAWDKWKGENEQVDDALVLGIKIP